MISRLARAQKSWVAKLILTLTALSFMSIFGVYGYFSAASNNRMVIKVDGIEISQAQFSYQLQKEIRSAQKLLGADGELDEDMRQALLQALTKQTVKNAVLDRTADKYHVLFSNRVLQGAILSNPAFYDAAGNFNRDAFRQALSHADMTEADYLDEIKRTLTSRMLIEYPVLGLNVPKVLLSAAAKADNKRRTFKYVMIKPSELSIDRKISDDEVEQYYEDFASAFIEPERRNLTVLSLSLAEIGAKMQVSDEDINLYYEAHKADFETPQTRDVLQIIFDDEESAKKAYVSLQKGADFYKTAEDAGQSKADTDLGYVTEEDLMEEIAEPVFELNKGAYTNPIQVGDMWQILKVADIKAATKVPYAEAAAQITKIIKDERLYDESYAQMIKIEDALGAGTDLAEIAKSYNADLLEVDGLAEDGSVKRVPQKIAESVKSPDFIDAAFSYNVGETSQVLETEDGFMVVKVNNITESHPQALQDVKPEIEEMWASNERTAIAQEKLNDVMHDLENGDELAVVAKRYGLKLYKSQPITRNETFAGLSYVDVREMFAEPLNTPRQIQQGDNYLIAVADKDYENSAPLSESEQNLVKQKAYMSLAADLGEALLSSYADEYKIKIKYKLLGFED